MKNGPVPDADNFKATYGPEDTENGKARILDLDAPRRKNERVMATLTDRAVRWLERQPRNSPFFLYFTPVAALWLVRDRRRAGAGVIFLSVFAFQ